MKPQFENCFTEQKMYEMIDDGLLVASYRIYIYIYNIEQTSTLAKKISGHIVGPSKNPLPLGVTILNSL